MRVCSPGFDRSPPWVATIAPADATAASPSSNACARHRQRTVSLSLLPAAPPAAADRGDRPRPHSRIVDCAIGLSSDEAASVRRPAMNARLWATRPARRFELAQLVDERFGRSLAQVDEDVDRPQQRRRPFRMRSITASTAGSVAAGSAILPRPVRRFVDWRHFGGRFVPAGSSARPPSVRLRRPGLGGGLERRAVGRHLLHRRFVGLLKHRKRPRA